MKACRGGCGSLAASERSRYCTDCRADRDAASKRRSKAAAKQPKQGDELAELVQPRSGLADQGSVPKVVIADSSCCGQYAMERRRLFDLLGREEAIRRASWLRHARCPQHAEDARIKGERQPKPRLLLVDDDWFRMGFGILHGESTGSRAYCNRLLSDDGDRCNRIQGHNGSHSVAAAA